MHDATPRAARRGAVRLLTVCLLSSKIGGLAPALVGSRGPQAGDDVAARIVLHGKENRGRGMIMPLWGKMDDQQFASILTYVAPRVREPVRRGPVREYR